MAGWYATSRSGLGSTPGMGAVDYPRKGDLETTEGVLYRCGITVWGLLQTRPLHSQVNKGAETVWFRGQGEPEDMSGSN